MKDLISTDGKKLLRVSRWIEVKTNYKPNKTNTLWDYVTDMNGYHPHQDRFDPSGGLELMYFRHDGKTYAVEQFWALGSAYISQPPIYYKEHGDYGTIGTVDMDGNIYHPLYAEWDECCEHVRLYEVE